VTTILPRSSPAAEGLDPRAVRLLAAGLDDLHAVHGFVLVRHGNVIAEGAWAPHTPGRPQMTFSVSKSFTATAVGLAIDDGLLSLDDRVVDVLADDAPAQPSAQLAAMRLRHLLTMTSGHAGSTTELIDARRGGWARQLLALPVAYEPGSRFVYNTGATYLAGLMVQRLTGQRLLDYLRPRLFEPLGITSATWEQSPDGFDVAGYGLSITTEELAAFGQLYLQRGLWQGRQLVPAAWVDEATAAHVGNGPHDWPEWEQGYGYQFWRCRHGAYRADGAFGQFAIVWPEHDLVLAVNAGHGRAQSILDAVWDALPPFLDRGAAVEPAHPEELSHPVPVETLALPTPAGAPTSPREPSILDTPHRLTLAGMSELMLGRDPAGHLVLRTDLWGGPQAVAFGYHEWLPATMTRYGQAADIATAAAWTDESTVVAVIAALGTPFVQTLTLRLEDSQLRVALDQNVSFGPTHLGEAVATAVL
jgi:CubicO group peptidase (beta-lactamase class C family)